MSDDTTSTTGPPVSQAPALPRCGLYRTAGALPGREEEVPRGALVYFHNHSAQGPPLVLLPSQNTHNAWTFHERGYLAPDPAWVGGLIALLPEGLYTLRQHLHAGESTLAQRTLVQLGYNRSGEPILFAGRREGNGIVFPSRGLRFSRLDVFDQLEPASFVLLEPPRAANAEPHLLH